MSQPIKNNKIQSGVKKSVYKKKKKPTVSEIIKKNIERSKKLHPKYGTSKLEKKFAKEFLDKLGIKYEEQFEAKDIKRFYDFYLSEYRILLEVDGSYYHGYGKTYEEKTPMQKKNERVDRIKDEWALSHGIPIIRIWEHDINKNPEKVFKILKEAIGIASEKMIIKENKKKRH
jgi:very-short-patch-repair endonuclease